MIMIPATNHMSSLEPRNKAYTLTNLPLSIQTRILSYLCPPRPLTARANRSKFPYCFPFRDPPVSLTLDYAGKLSTPLPSELISPALASPILAAAAANLLGDRVSYLTQCNTSGQLHNWISAFAPYVKAVSAQEPFLSWYIGELEHADEFRWLARFDTQFEQSVQLVKPLSSDAIRLEVLDLIGAHFLIWSPLEDDLLPDLCRTLESNSSTLRELALPVFDNLDIFDKALEMSTLRKLDTLIVKRCRFHSFSDSKTLAPPFLRIIRAIDGHADRVRKLTTLRELRFLHFRAWGCRFFTPSDRDASVFYSVKILRLVVDRWFVEKEIHRCVSLFKNLECLFWNLGLDSLDSSLAKIGATVPEVHFSIYRWINMPMQVGADSHHEDRCSMFEETSLDIKHVGTAAIRTFIAGRVSKIELRNMMKCCPNLENLSVHVSKQNMRAIRKLVARCQQMKCLELAVDERNGRLDEEDWRSISRIIPKSHKNLCQVAIQNQDHVAPATRCMEAVFRCFESVTKSLGERARRLAFRMKFRTRCAVKIIEKICGVLSVCLQHSSMLESMELLMNLPKEDSSNYDGDWEQGVVRRLSQLESQLLSDIQSLHTLDLGITRLFREKLHEYNVSLDTDPLCKGIDVVTR